MRFKQYLRSRLDTVIPDNIPLPSGFHLVGHVVLVELKSQAMEYAQEIGQVTLEFNKHFRTIAVKTGPTKGITRRPSYRIIAGDPNSVTTHIENGVRFRLDPLRITFSRGNRWERALMAEVVGNNETVIDMFACVGQFTLPIARIAGAKVVALEINQEAFTFLKENISLNNVTDKVDAILGDCRKTIPENVADRVIMGYLHNTVSFLPFAMKGLKKEGGMIHLHALVHSNDTSKICNTINTIITKGGYAAQIKPRRVKRYSPRVDHYCFDIKLTRNCNKIILS